MNAGEAQCDKKLIQFFYKCILDILVELNKTGLIIKLYLFDLQTVLSNFTIPSIELFRIEAGVIVFARCRLGTSCGGVGTSLLVKSTLVVHHVTTCKGTFGGVVFNIYNNIVFLPRKMFAKRINTSLLAQV